MSDEQQHYLSYLLRLWQEPASRPEAWRASLQNPQTGELLGFADVAQLFTFLEQQLVAATASGRSRRIAKRSSTADTNFADGVPLQKGVVLPATQENSSQAADSAPTTGTATADT